MRMPGVAMPWLVGYYGVFQAGHVVFNVVYLSGLRPIPEFPWPPAEGWHPQATAFWTATGLIDTAIALLALYFVAAFFGGRRRALWAGLVSLATSSRSHNCRRRQMSKSVPDLEQALARTSRGRARRPVEPHEDRPPRVMIAIHVDPEVRDQLRAIAYEQKVPLRGLVCAGLNAVFAQHHKPEIAR